MKEEPKRLYRSAKDKIIAGVCGGIAEYFNIDPVWVRLVAVLLFFMDGIGFMVYIIAWILIPSHPKETKKTVAEKVAMKIISAGKAKKKSSRARVIFGLIIVFIGIGFLMQNLLSWFDFNYVWPCLIIIIGLYLLLKGAKND